MYGHKAETNNFKYYLNKISRFLCPMINLVLFQPILRIALQVFSCLQAIDRNLDNELTLLNGSESFMEVDCNQYCFEGIHVWYAVLALFVLTVFTLNAVYARPF